MVRDREHHVSEVNNIIETNLTLIGSTAIEDRLQEKKRQIRLIQPRFIPTIVEEFENKIDEIL